MAKVLKVTVVGALFCLSMTGINKAADLENNEPSLILSSANMCTNMPICRWSLTQDDSVAELKALQETRPTLLS